MYVDECLEGVRRLMESDFAGPVNIGSDELISINDLARLAMKFSGKTLTIKHIDGPLGVRGRSCDNTLIHEKLGWNPTRRLAEGYELTCKWVFEQMARRQES